MKIFIRYMCICLEWRGRQGRKHFNIRKPPKILHEIAQNFICLIEKNTQRIETPKNSFIDYSHNSVVVEYHNTDQTPETNHNSCLH